MRSFLLAAALPAMLTLGCGSEVENPPLPNIDVPKDTPKTITTAQGKKKVTKLPLAPVGSPSKPD